MSAQITCAKTAYFRRILHILIGIGSAIGRTLVQAAEAGASVRTAAAAYERVAHSIRRMIMLAMQIGAPSGAEPTPSRAEADHDRRESADFADPAERGGAAEPREAGYDLADKTMDEIISEICRDLGLPPLDSAYPWTSLTPAAIAKLVAKAAESLLGRPVAPDPEAEDQGGPWPTPAWLASKAPPDPQPQVPDG